MIKLIFNYTFLILVVILTSCADAEKESVAKESKNQLYKPWDIFPELFHEIQMQGVFEDSKTFVDCVPLQDPIIIKELYEERKSDIDFDLTAFVNANFKIPEDNKGGDFSVRKPFVNHLNGHWDYLTRATEETELYSTLIKLPKKYVVPGGRFREIYYWDSYFTMIGLGASGRKDLIRNMLDNFAYLIDTIGYIPNGNRTYFLGRSQPPFFAAMVGLYANITSLQYATDYLPALRKEYDFWMKGHESVNDSVKSIDRVVFYKGYILNRYFDNAGGPRQESYREDVELADEVQDKEQLFLNIRAACESGWDFSSRWFKDPNDFSSIRTTEILPVDLNALLYNAEVMLALLYQEEGNEEEANRFRKASENRYNAINELFWNEEQSIFQDILWMEERFNTTITAASFYPLYFKSSNREHAQNSVPVLLDTLLQDGGLLTTPLQSGQQWDAPNGWAPLNWMAYQGMKYYDFMAQANDLKNRWLTVNKKVFEATGKMMEKYNVADTSLLAGGGEYPNQDGFGWTNGVALGMEADSLDYSLFRENL